MSPDLALLTELGALLRRCDPVPAAVIADAEAAIAHVHAPPVGAAPAPVGAA